MGKIKTIEFDLTTSDIHRFFRYLKKGKIDECWEWQGSRCKKGYGGFRIGSAIRKAHRVSYKIFNGDIPYSLWVLHKCDNLCCCNPKHLYTGTHQDNMRDAHERERFASGDRSGARTHPKSRACGKRNGRHTCPERTARGSKNGKSKLDEDKVREIKKKIRKKMAHRIIAGQYGVAKVTISEISMGKTWKHVMEV